METNKSLALLFDHLADLYLLRGKDEDKYRISSYRRISNTLRYFQHDIAEYDKKGELLSLPGVGPHIAEKIHEYVTTGSIKSYERLKGEFPQSLLDLMEIPSLGPKKVSLLWKELGVVDRQSLEEALRNGKAEQLPGFGQKSIENILKGIKIGEKIKKRKFLAEMIPIVDILKKYLENSKLATEVEVAGSFRRKEETVGDLDFLATSKKPKALIDYFVSYQHVKQVLAQGDTKASVILDNNLQVDLRVVKNDEWGSALQYFTGSKDHNVHMRTIAREKGLTVSEYGVFTLNRKGEKLKRIAGKTEEEVYRALGMQWIPPEMRTDTGEIEAALKKTQFPKLISYCSLKGDLHAHTRYSDGIHTIEIMAKEAQSQGLEYIALTDHSSSLIVAHGLSLKDLAEKRTEIEAVQKKVKIKILMGTEVDILADGNLDYSDHILETFDIVVASVHSGFTKDNTKRIMKAMENPYVHIIGHISGRMIGTREAYPLDYESLFKKAVETGTFIEINAQPYRQDISWDHIRRAKELGVKFVISTDSHSKDTLWFRDLGVAIARRGWLTKEDVINTAKLEKFLNMMK